MSEQTKETVAIIGGGVSGLSAARWLAAYGFEVTVLELHDEIGGQWNRTGPNSGVWPQMRTNTAKFVTKLSDVSYPETVSMFPRNGEVLDMLNDFVDQAGIRDRIRCGVQVTALEAMPKGGYNVSWDSRSATEGGTDEASSAEPTTQRFDRVVVATGRFNKPEIPAIDGLDSFTGAGGVIHAFRYKDPEVYSGMRVVVCGGSISALEIASDLAMLGTRRVHLAQRRQRYVMPKMYAGTPLEYLTFTREGALALETTRQDELLAQTREMLLKLGGNPAQYGAPAPHEDISKAGVTGSQHYLNLVAEDRIDVRPWVQSIDGDLVTFTDGSCVQADAIIIGTGFDLSLPFLSDELKRTVELTTTSILLTNFTFHPDLPGLAFLGLWQQLGPYPVVLEQQARYLAYTWAGAIPAPTLSELVQGLADCNEQGHHVGYRSQHEMAIRFARLAGTDPSSVEDDELRFVLAKSAVTGEMFRIVGNDALPGAADQVKSDFARYAPQEVRNAHAASHDSPA